MSKSDKDISDKIKQMREQNSQTIRKKKLEEQRQFALDKFNNRPKDQK